MTKDFKEYTTQTAVFQNQNLTLSMYANLEPAEKHNFAQILSSKSKIKVFLNDFSKGKGDAAIKVYYNLEIGEIKYILDKATLGLLPAYTGIKSLDTYPEKDGPFKGLCQIRIFSVEYVQNYRNPWKVTITNGYGRKGEIQEGKKQAQTFVTDVRFLEMFRSTYRYIESYIDIIKKDLIVNGLRTMEERNSRGYTNDFQQPDIPQYSETEYAETEYSQSYQSVQSPTEQKQTKKEIHTVPIRFVSDFVALQKCYCVQIESNGKMYNLYLQNLDEQLLLAKQNNTVVNANLYSWNGTLCFDSLAA